MKNDIRKEFVITIDNMFYCIGRLKNYYALNVLRNLLFLAMVNYRMSE